MRKLWAPWRIEYVKQGGAKKGCFFCTLPAEAKDSDNLILKRGRTGFVILNSFPYNSGHMMVAPFKHTADMYELEDEELLEICHLIRAAIRTLTAVMKPDGFNLGVNLGKTAGAGVVDHIHWHIVPRWNGDTNFMPVTAATKVLPEHLRATYERLKAEWDKVE